MILSHGRRIFPPQLTWPNSGHGLALIVHWMKPSFEKFISKIKSIDFSKAGTGLRRVSHAVKNSVQGKYRSFRDGGFPAFKEKIRLGASEQSARLKEKFSQVREKFSTSVKALPAHVESIKELRKLEPQEVYRRTLETLSKSSLPTYARGLGTVLIAYFLADTAALLTDFMLPEPPAVPSPQFKKSTDQAKRLEDYSKILTRNIFSSRGLIPEDENIIDPNGPARKSNLPLNLIGTVVLRDETKSIAAVEDKQANQIFPLRVEEELDRKIRIKKIEHLKVTFVNLSTGGLEYIDMPEDGINTNVTATPSAVSKGPIEKEGDRFTIQRSEINKAFTNFNQVLTQARAIPNFENGVPNGFKIVQIVPGSIYQKLGINEGDVVTSVNGEPMNDPSKAFMLLNEIRSGSSNLELGLKGPDGKARTQTYNVY